MLIGLRQTINSGVHDLIVIANIVSLVLNENLEERIKKDVNDGTLHSTSFNLGIPIGFCIIMKVLCLKLGQPTTFDCQFRIMGQSIALRHGRNDIDAFERVMASTSVAKIDNPAPVSRIIEAYNYFVDHIDENKLSIMTVMMNAQFVRIDLNADEDEQQIFNTINSLGVNLTTSELLKNYFFSRNTISEYEAKWASVFEKDGLLNFVLYPHLIDIFLETTIDKDFAGLKILKDMGRFFFRALASLSRSR